MEVFEAVRTVLAVRRFKDAPVPDAVIAKVLEAGRLTASAVNLQPWHFIVVKDRQRLAELATHTSTGRYSAQASVAIVVAVEKTRWAVSDASRAIQDMILVAWAEGVGSNWVGFSGMLNGLKPFLGIPNRLDVLAVLPLGYPEVRLGKGKKRRKALSEIASLERFGELYR
jgi:nitroreductase